MNLVAVRGLRHGRDGGVEIEIHPVLQLIIKILQHDIVDVGAQMAYLGVQEMQAVFQASALEVGIAGGIELGPLPAVAKIDLVHIAHQAQGFLLADMLIQGAAELVGDVVFAVGKSTGAAEAAHDAADRAADAGLDLFAVDGASALIQRTAELEHGDLQTALHQLIGGIDPAGAGADDDHVIIHAENTSFSFIKQQSACGSPQAPAQKILH